MTSDRRRSKEPPGVDSFRVHDDSPRTGPETGKVNALPALHKYFQKKDTEPVDFAAPRSTCK
jgi:hypothetical protein